MAVNKVFPRVLSKSKDTRVRKKTEMSDALNVRATESLDAFKKGLDEGGDAGNEISNSGNMGVVKPVLGNTIIDVEGAGDGIVDTQSEYSIIGSVTDEAKGVVYFFMWHQNPSKHAVLMYDDSVGNIQMVFQNRFFNFYYNSVVQGSVTHVSSVDSGEGVGEKTFLYFTDNYNEPRCLDVLACLRGDSAGYSDSEIVEFISMCPITPLKPIVPVWGYDPLRTSSAFRNSRGIQFAYQNVYSNGTVSAFSIYSKLAVNPAYLGQGADPTPDSEAFNYISVRVPEQSQNVNYVKLYAREGNDGSWFYIDDINAEDVAGSPVLTGPHQGFQGTDANGQNILPYTYFAYRYYGDRLISYVPEDITFKQFDSVPKLAEAFDICSDRSFFGNYVEGYDRVNVDANISYISRPRPDDFQAVDLKLVPEVRPLPPVFTVDAQNNLFQTTAGVRNRVSGYRLDMSQAPQFFEAGSTLNISITCNPDQNIHLYQAKDSFHSSVFLTYPSGEGFLSDKLELSSPEDLETVTGYQSRNFDPCKQVAGFTFGSNRTLVSGGQPAFMRVQDCGFDPVADIGDTIQSQPSAVWHSNELRGNVADSASTEVAYGTSASNPLILSGAPMSFNCRLFIENGISKTELKTILGGLLSGYELINSGEAGPGQILSTDVSLIDVKSTSSYSINLGLNSYSYFGGQSANARKVCFVTPRSQTSQTIPTNCPPCGYFIVNKADVTFGLINITNPQVFEPSLKYKEGTYFDLIGENNYQTEDLFFALDLLSIENEEVLTCIPDIKGGYQNSAATRVNVMMMDYPQHISDYSETTGILGAGGYSDFDQMDAYRAWEGAEKPSNRVSGWVCLRRSTVASILNGATSIEQLLTTLSSFSSRNDIKNIYELSYRGGVLTQFGQELGNESLSFTTCDYFPEGREFQTAYGEVYPNPNSPTPGEPGVNDSQYGFYDTFPEDFSPSNIHLKNIQMLLGYMDLPGRAIGSGGGVDPALDGGRPPGGGNGVNTAGTLVCTRRRIVNELNAQILSDDNQLNEAQDAQFILTSLLGYTLLDGEAGPGSNRDISSINATTIRDGILYYFAGRDNLNPDGLGPQGIKDAFAAIVDVTEHIAESGVFENTPFSSIGPTLINHNMTANGSMQSRQFMPPNGVALGYFINPFEYYLGQTSVALIENTTSVGLDFNGTVGITAPSLAAYDGQLFVAYKNSGSVNINFSDFLEEEQIAFGDGPQADSLPSYSFTDPIGWYRQFIPHVEISQQLSFVSVGGDAADRKTFKANAFHDFGIVYADFYGRQGTVQPLGTTFVPPMRDQVNGDGGPIDIQIQLNNTPPSWAHSYQIVYAGNTSYDKFIQYTAGGGFIVQTESEINDDLGLVSTGNIYVSLNYLQGNSDVSYVNAFGARNPDGGDTFYEYRPGDKLRVVSYNDGGSRIYANNIEFDVIDTVILGDDPESNPLWSGQNGETIPKYLTGNFIVLKNNPQAIGFNVASIGANELPNGSSLWNNRCVVEIYTPSFLRNEDERPYREIGESFKVLRAQGDIPGTSVLTHQYNPLTLKDGDVYFRRHAVNLAPFTNGAFASIVQPEEASIPSFFNFYLESETFSDTILNADQYNYGRAKTVDPNAAEIRRYASIIFSDQDDYTDLQLRLNSYDATKQPFKDLPNSYGAIACLLDYNDSLFVLQNTKASAVPVNRTIVSDASGSETVLATSKVLGVQRFYAGENGCDTNPESVALYGNTVFWANKQKGEVYKFTPSSGVQIISDKGMKAYFRDMFSSLLENQSLTQTVRVAGGYDAEHNEYIISAYNQQLLDFTGTIEIAQDDAVPGETAEDEFSDFTETQGDLTLEEEQDLLNQLEEALVDAEAFRDLEESLEEAENEIIELVQQISVLQTELDLAGASGGTAVTEIGEEISDLLQQAADLDQEAQEYFITLAGGIVEDSNSHTSIRGVFETAKTLCLGMLETLGYSLETLPDFQIAASAVAAGNTYAGVNAVFVGGGVVEDEFDLVEGYSINDFTPEGGFPAIIVSANLISAAVTFDQMANFWYLDDMVPFYRRGASDPPTAEDIYLEYRIGYGAGPDPSPLSYIANALSEEVTLLGLLSGRERFNQRIAEAVDFIARVSAFNNIAVQQVLESYSELQQSAFALNQQVVGNIYDIVLGISTFLVPDLTKENLEDLPGSASDYTIQHTPVTLGEATSLGPAAIVPVNFISDIIATDGDYSSLLTVLTLYAQENQSFSSMISYYISLALHKNVTVPAIERFESYDQQLANVVITRDALAFALARIMNNIDVSSGGEFLQALLDSGINATLASAITSAYGSTGGAFAAILNALDSDGDGVITQAEVEAMLPTGSLSLAFGSLGGSQTWEGVKSDISGLLEGVFNLAESMGLTGPSEDFEEGFDVSDVEALEFLRARLEDPLWSEGDEEFISETVDEAIRIVQGKAESQASLISIYEELESTFQQISTIASNLGYSLYQGGDLTADIQSEVYRGVWHNAVDAVGRDIGMAISHLRNWQNLFSAQVPNELNQSTSTSYLDGEVQVGINDLEDNLGGYWSNYSPIGLRGVQAENILSGENILIDLAGDGSVVVPGFSGWLGLSSVLSKVNENIKTLLDQSTDFNLDGMFSFSLGAGETNNVTSLTAQTWAALPENQRNLYAVINGAGVGTGDVISDLEGAFVDPSLAFTTQDVANFVSNALNTESEFYNADFADSVVNALIRPTFSLGYESNESQETGDFNQDGIAEFQDLFELALLFVNVHNAQNLTITGSIYPEELPDQFTLPGATLDALQAIASATSGTSFQGAGEASFYDQFIEE